MKYDNTDILVAITNYDFSRNADRLKGCFSTEFATVLIDASSPQPPRHTDKTIPNTYYPGLWNAAVEIAIEQRYAWLFFLASDVAVKDPARVCKFLREATEDSAIGIYTPSLSRKSRASFPATLCRKTGRLRRCELIEGFAFLARTEILQEIYPITKANQYGWVIDVLTCHRAKQKGYQVVVDDRTLITHPPRRTEHEIDTKLAAEAGLNYAKSMGLSENHLYSLTNKAKSPANRWHYPTLSMRRCLDLGCGPQPRNPYSTDETYGIDLVEQKVPAGVFFRKADLEIEKIPWPDNHFDVITAFDFIDHISRVSYIPARRNPFIELMHEIWRCLKPNGIFHSLTPAYPAKEAFQGPTHVNIITEDTFKLYFCGPLWAEMYGFKGQFTLEDQGWEEGCKLRSIMRKN